jgi:hypothetical protein
MLDRYVREGDTHVSVKQLPHDAADAARLYGELSDRARNAIIEAIPLENALFTAKVVIERDNRGLQVRGIAVAKLNGRTLRVEHTMDDRGEYGHPVRMDMLRALADKMAHRVAELFVVEGSKHAAA